MRMGHLAAVLAAVATIGLVVPPSSADISGDAAAIVFAGQGTAPEPCDWPMYGAEPARTFSATCSEIAPDNVSTLVPKWVLKTPATVTASPAVADGRVFVGDWTGTMYALDADDGSVLWDAGPFTATGAAFGPVVSSAAVAEGKVIFGAGPTLYALHAGNGTEAWTHTFDATEGTPVEVESSPVVHEGVVYVGMDNHNREHTDHPGGVFAFDLDTGALLRAFHPEQGQDRGCGGVWSSPAIDTEDGRLYLATANCPRPEEGDGFDWNEHIEAVTALDLDTFEALWTFQPHEPFNGEDHDFGATPNLFVDANGRKVLGAGNKNGHYYVLDAATGAPIHDIEVSDDGYVQDGFAIGGYLGSPAVWDGRVFGGTAIPTPDDADGSPPFERTAQGVYAALDPATGEIAWRAHQAPTYAASAASNGVIFHGALDNLFRAYDADTGVPLWAQPLSGPISSGAAVAGDSVYVGAGTSSSDACAKDVPIFSDLCLLAFDTVLGSTGGVHAFHLAL